MLESNLLIYGGVALLLFIMLLMVIHHIKKYLYVKKLQSPRNFSQKVQNGYMKLKNLLLYKSNKDELKKAIQNIGHYKIDGRYVGGYNKQTIEFDSLSFVLDYFYEVLNYVESNGETFILNFNNRVKRQEFEEKLQLSLGELSNNIKFPLEYLSLEEDTFLEKKEILEYQKILLNHNIQMAFIDDNSDSYNIILHNKNRASEVSKAVSLIGLKYHKDLKFYPIFE